MLIQSVNLFVLIPPLFTPFLHPIKIKTPDFQLKIRGF